jgi:hypothetical protein
VSAASTARELLGLSRTLLSRPDAATAGLWPRASALLARQALEATLDQYWIARGMPMDTRATLPKLICLAEFLGDADLAARVRSCWGALSDVCHHHAYELAPTVAELSVLLDVVDAFVTRIDSHA